MVQILLAIASLFLLVTCAAAQSSSIDPKLAAQYFRQLEQTSSRDGGKTWGVALYGPMILVDPVTRNVVANQADLENKLVSRYSFNPNDVIGIDASNTVYPTLRLMDNWGVLTVINGAWLERAPTGQLIRARVPAPQDLSGRPLKGEGWSLELAKGWEVVPGQRPGDVTIKKK